MRFWAFLIFVANGLNAFGCVKAIARGYDAASGQFPYVVQLKVHFATEYGLCGGSLISPAWILTAAHCLEDFIIAEVYLGSIFKDRPKIAYAVDTSDITIHPQYDGDYLLDDIALIKIPRTGLSTRIAIVPLPKIRRSPSKYAKAYVRLCGWGRKSRHGEQSKILQWGRLRILKNKKCRYTVSKKDLCTAVSPNLASPCLGDSGGPLVLETTGELVGILKLGSSSCEKPAVYTRVSHYLDWIKSVSGVSY